MLIEQKKQSRRTPHQPSTFAWFPTWRVRKELVASTLSRKGKHLVLVFATVMVYFFGINF